MKIINIFLSLILCLFLMSQVVCADVTNPKEGYKLFEKVLFLPAAVVQLVFFDIPGGVLSIFDLNKKKFQKFEKSMESVDWKNRYQTVVQLGKEKDTRAYDLLIKALSDSQVIVSIRAYDELLKVDRDEALPLLVKNLESRDPWTRKLSMDILGIYGDTAVTRQLVFMANDINRDVKLSALIALESLSGESMLNQYFPVGANTEPNGKILDWWYMRGKIIEQINKN